MTDLLERLDKWLRANRPDYYKLLLPGAKESDLARVEQALGYSLPESFHRLYLWKNGQDPMAVGQAFQYNRDFLTLESAKDSHEICSGCAESGDWEPKENIWSVKWFPFLQHWGGDLLCVDTECSFGGRPGQIVYFYHDSDDRTIEFPSLENWLETFVVTLEAGLWREDECGFQPADDAKVDEVIKRLNPGYPIYEEAG